MRIIPRALLVLVTPPPLLVLPAVGAHADGGTDGEPSVLGLLWLENLRSAACIRSCSHPAPPSPRQRPSLRHLCMPQTPRSQPRRASYRSPPGQGECGAPQRPREQCGPRRGEGDSRPVQASTVDCRGWWTWDVHIEVRLRPAVPCRLSPLRVVSGVEAAVTAADAYDDPVQAAAVSISDTKEMHSDTIPPRSVPVPGRDCTTEGSTTTQHPAPVSTQEGTLGERRQPWPPSSTLLSARYWFAIPGMVSPGEGERALLQRWLEVGMQARVGAAQHRP